MSYSRRVKPSIAISGCLMGEAVRYNGGHKENRFCSKVLSEHFELVTRCPEMAIGLGVPREPIRLIGEPEDPRARGTVDVSRDVTAPLAEYGRQMANELDDICGYIFMHKSPSCGLERVKLYRPNGLARQEGAQGIYSRAFCEMRPDLPVEEDGRLCDPVLRENFLVRVYAYSAWQALLAQGLSRGALMAFHSRYKYQLMANNPEQYKKIGHLLGSMGRGDAEEIGPLYFSQLMQALKRCATRGTHSNVLQHISGYLRGAIETEDRHELQALIDQYRSGIVPLIAPLTLLKHLFRRHPDPYIAQQVYLQPHPENLSLRNAI